MSEEARISPTEARFFARLVNAYSSAQTVVEQLKPILEEFGLLKSNGGLNTDRILWVQKRAREQAQKGETG
jgi:hypothetical protein